MLSAMEEIARWAEEQYEILNAKQRVASAERADLQQAGVSAHRIEALYPFDPADYAPGILEVLQDPSRRLAVSKELYYVNVPFKLSTHLPRLIHEELFAYLDKGPTTPEGNFTPYLRMAQHSEALAQFVENGRKEKRPMPQGQAGLTYMAETMLQLPRFLHLLRQHPFVDHRWEDDERSWWREKFDETKPHIEAYTALL
jgi:hypothetical protein